MTEKDLIFFKPLWRRVVATLVCVIWAALEWYAAEPLWAMIATGLAGYAYWNFFVKFDDSAEQ